VVAGSSGLDRVIRYVDIIEVPDYTNWLRPNVLSITCAYAARDNPDAQVNLVRHLARSDAAGLAVKPGRFLGAMPEEMIRAADEEGLPLIEIPVDLPYIEITHPLQAVIMDDELRDSECQKLARAKAMKDTRRRILAEFLNEVLVSRLSPAFEELATARASLLGLDLECPYTVGAFKTRYATAKESGNQEQNELLGRLERYVERAGRSLTVKTAFTVYDPGIVALLMPRRKEEPSSGSEDRNAGEERPDRVIDRLIRVLDEIRREPFSKTLVSVGLSSMQTGVSGIANGYAQAMQALTEQPHREDCFFVTQYDGTSPSVLLHGLSRRQLEDYYTAVLGQLDGNRALLNTLRVFLEQGCQTTLSAASLFVHRNTLTYRLNSIEKILKCDLRDPDVQLKLRLAILAGALSGKYRGRP